MGLLKQIEYLCNRTYNSGLFVHCIREMSRQENSPFQMFEQLNAFGRRQQINPQELTEAGICQMLYAFSSWRGYEKTATDMLKLDCLLKNRRPRLILPLEYTQEQKETSKAFFQVYGRRFAHWNGKRPWHFARVEHFSFDVERYLKRGELCREDEWYLFSYWQTPHIEKITQEIRAL